MRWWWLGAMLICSCAAVADDHGYGWTYTRDGNPRDAVRKTQFGILFGGGGGDVDEAYRWMCAKAGNGDFLVLRSSGTAAYNPYLRRVCPGLNSAATLFIENSVAAQDPFVLRAVESAEAIFLAGGDQSNYEFYFRGPLAGSIHSAVARGVPIGGTSAGNAVLAQFAYSAYTASVTSAEALADPYSPLVTISDSFLKTTPLLNGAIADDHFAARNRMGRLLVFLARIMQDQGLGEASGIGVDERTAFLMEGDGAGSVAGAGAVYFARVRGGLSACRPETALSIDKVEVYRIRAGGRFNLKTWTGTGGSAYVVSVKDGNLTSTQAGGDVY